MRNNLQEQLACCQARLARKRAKLVHDPDSAPLRRAVLREERREEELEEELAGKPPLTVAAQIQAFAEGHPTRTAWAQEWLRRLG